MQTPKIGIALGGGGARGWAHIGVLVALAEEGIEPDIVCGCSMGAIVGASYVGGKLDDLGAWARAVDWRRIAGFLDVNITRGGLIDGARIMSFLADFGLKGTIETMPKPFLAVATDLKNGREIWLREGRLDDAVRASIALPGLFSPVLHEDRWLVDGGLVNPVPVSACRAMGADLVIAVNLNADIVGKHGRDSKQGKKPKADVEGRQWALNTVFEDLPANIASSLQRLAPRLVESHDDVPSYIAVTAGAINIMQDRITRSRLAGEPPHFMIAPSLGHIGVLEFDRAREAIALGAKNARPIARSIVEFIREGA